MVAEPGYLCDEVQNVMGNLTETKRSLAADETLATELSENWDSESSELPKDDGTVELFKTTVTRRVMDELRRCSPTLCPT